jgi:hypothetical protein
MIPEYKVFLFKKKPKKFLRVFNRSGLSSRSGPLIIEGLNLCVRQENFSIFDHFQIPVAVNQKRV